MFLRETIAARYSENECQKHDHERKSAVGVEISTLVMHILVAIIVSAATDTLKCILKMKNATCNRIIKLNCAPCKNDCVCLSLSSLQFRFKRGALFDNDLHKMQAAANLQRKTLLSPLNKLKQVWSIVWEFLCCDRP